MQHSSIPKELTVCRGKKKRYVLFHLGKKAKQIIHMWNFYECLRTV